MPNKSILPENSAALPLEITQQATEWYVRLQDDQFSEQDYAEFQCWLQQDLRHQQAWQCLQQFGLSLANIKHPLFAQAMAAIEQKEHARPHYSLKSLLGLLIFTGAIWAVYQAQQQQLWQQWQADYKTKVGQQKQIELADGSKIILNTNSAINVHYDHSQRQIELIKGEIYIDVGQDLQHRPFSIQNRDGIMQDIGTRFHVRQNHNHTLLAVSDGEVKVTTKLSQHSVHVLPQQQVQFDQHRLENITPLNSQYTAWTHGTLSVYRMPLIEFISELDRYSPTKLRYDDSIQQAGLEVSGVFPIQDPEKVLHSLEQQLPIKVEAEFYYWKKVSLDKK
ncbi:FecR domain-containing protein [Acinetobacter larvae]|uniref:Iron dicitrate transport regulator FecR n=1 Tax=Acinetobacter larvae TaxID=1789224 RepID=A0A1B2M3G4_9GAMM|nr:FecR domain-containing protein [Acinetobacter larvae]AOA59738.1 hypothetical protein BFG52_16215 [Acinetobacter larvae]